MSSPNAFQSHAGSIEASHLAQLGPFWSLVFQSHAGSIEATSALGVFRIPAPFQSHAGSIEADTAICIAMMVSKFQSHAGSIEALLLSKSTALSSSVSIPRWFD